MSYFCPQCGEQAKRHAGATEQAEGMPVVCKTHGRVFVNTRTLPIWGLLTKPLSTPERVSVLRHRERSALWAKNNPEKRKQYRAAHAEREKVTRKAWQEAVYADPERAKEHREKRAAYWRAYRAKNKEAYNAKNLDRHRTRRASKVEKLKDAA